MQGIEIYSSQWKPEPTYHTVITMDVDDPSINMY